MNIKVEKEKIDFSINQLVVISEKLLNSKDEDNIIYGRVIYTIAELLKKELYKDKKINY